MTPFEKRRRHTSPLTQRMAEDMRIRHLSPRTIDAYTYHVERFTVYFGRPLDELGPEEIRQFQLHLLDRGVSWSSFNQAVCGLRFLYSVTLPRDWPVTQIPFGKRAKRLPTVLGVEEVERILACVSTEKHRTVLLVCYAAGLRLGEATGLRIADIDGPRRELHVDCGKGNKQRRVPLSPRLLEALREYWKLDRPGHYLFPGRTADVSLSHSTVQKACSLAAARAGIRKEVTPHTLRHSYATGLLEAGVDLLTISRLLGHSSFVTTMVYLHCRRPHLERAPSPLDWLPTRQCPKWAEAHPPEHDPSSASPPPADHG